MRRLRPAVMNREMMPEFIAALRVDVQTAKIDPHGAVTRKEDLRAIAHGADTRKEDLLAIAHRADARSVVHHRGVVRRADAIPNVRRRR